MSSQIIGSPNQKHAIDSNQLLEQLRQSVEQEGFLTAWGRYFPAIVQAHHAGADSVLGRSLYELMLGDSQLAAHFTRLDPEPRAQLDQYLTLQEIPRSLWESQKHSDFVDALRNLVHSHSEAMPEIVEGDGRPLQCLRNETFRNWGQTIHNNPALTCFPQTKVGVCNLVKWSASNNKTVRVSGYRHTWGDLYSADEQVLIALLPLEATQHLPSIEPAIDPNDQLQGITIVGTITEDGRQKALCKIGAATTNEQFRRWCLDEQGGNWAWTVPLNVIMVEITWGGSNAPICHGAGWRNQTLSDLVVEIEFVNTQGELQTVNDPELLHSAAGCFGLLGVVTSITLKLDPMSFARMNPVKPQLALAIPPPPGLEIPAAITMSGMSNEQLEQAWNEFVHRCENDYYSEWFWFPYQDRCWVNTWLNDGDRADAQAFPTALETVIQQEEEYLGELINTTLFKLLPGHWQASLLGASAMAMLPSDTTIVAPLIDALHFRRGIQNMRVLDMELEIPIPGRADNPTQPDWSIPQKAWWAVLTSIYKRDDAPMRITLEMRIMGGSQVTMAPQYGNQHGTCAIEILTNLNVSPKEWQTFMQEIADAWDELTDGSGNRLNVRPHWAKQWQGLNFRTLPVNEYLRQVAYRDQIPTFRKHLEAVCQAGGYTLADIQRRFSNPLLNDIFAAVFAE